MRTIESISIANPEHTLKLLVEFPDTCPWKNHKFVPKFKVALHSECEDYILVHAIFYCELCLKCFMVIYQFGKSDSGKICSSRILYIIPATTQTTDFSTYIKNEYPRFVEVYHQAELAEQKKLNEICGLGYRKSFEILVKDYLIKQHPDDRDTIVDCRSLKRCIDKYLTNENAHTFALASAYLGNDEAHYLKIHTEYGIEELKSNIINFVAYIELEISSARAKSFLANASNKTP